MGAGNVVMGLCEKEGVGVFFFFFHAKPQICLFWRFTTDYFFNYSVLTLSLSMWLRRR
jgi:hypothetical protein